ncbi:GTPase family protein [Crocosphaera chwakensis]|uniref:Small GTP-binding protein domain n=1 Tax=Crocosphaera chwakensis CCY0110 TaxID=391612 RepID=A3IJW3_9CHRO|nr:GTPase [Crocosphaera chwakensis]EAZ94095.1 Small GTP-binding protein domain [Crocosphaera chwakensis CCY0110]
MIKLKSWQWVILASPLVIIVSFFIIAAGLQIHQWGINWIWGIFILMLLGWRWLLVKWTKPVEQQIETLITQVNEEVDNEQKEIAATIEDKETFNKIESILAEIIQETRNDRPFWEDWATFWQRCQNLVSAIAHIYHPEIKYPLLNIYIPQAYGLIRGTVDDLDRWMQKLSPVLSQVSIAQAYQAYEVYQQLEPNARKLWRVWNWSQWILNPAAAIARQTSLQATKQANQQLLVNLGQTFRETALKTLAQQAIALYSDKNLLLSDALSVQEKSLSTSKTETLRDIIAKAKPVKEIEAKPVNILLAGRTGAGKSSLINTLFKTDKAEVDILPSTDNFTAYHWDSPTGDYLTLWDTPGYEQINRPEFREEVLNYCTKADLLLLVTPALDPSLDIDITFLKAVKEVIADLPIIVIVTQVDRLRPVREWQPPYNWQQGTLSKEVSIREATTYRIEVFGEECDMVLPLVTSDATTNRDSWGVEALTNTLLEFIEPSKQLRLARFLQQQKARSVAATKIIETCTLRLSTTQGITALLKSPVLQFISTLSTGSPGLAYALAEQIPVEQLPIVIGKLQMAYDLFCLFEDDDNKQKFDLLSLWPLLLDTSGDIQGNAWAFGQAFVEFLTKDLTTEQLRKRFNEYLES